MPKHTFLTDLYVDGAWADISGDVRADPPISCERGRRDESSHVTAGRCSLTLDNTGGTYSPRNPTSSLYGKIGRNTPLRVSLDTPAQDVADTFDDRTVVNGWGSAQSGGAYTLTTAGGGSANDFDVAAGFGTIVVGGANRYGLAHLPGVSIVDGEALLNLIDLPAIAGPTGASLEPAGVAFRMRSTTDYYLARIEWTTANGIVIKVYSPDDTELTNTTVFTVLQWSPGENLRMRVRWEGEAIRVRVWQADQSEPAAWNVELYDSTYTGPGWVGVRAGIAAGNTDGSQTFGFGSFTVDSRTVLFTGEVSEWPPRWNIPGTDVTAPIEAAGIMRRLAQGAKSLRSPLYRAIVATSPLAYWPLEDGANADWAASAVGGQPMTGTVAFNAVDGPAGSGRVLDLSTRGELSGPIPTVVSTEWRVEAVVRWPSASTVDSTVVGFEVSSAGSVSQWRVVGSDDPDRTIDVVYFPSGASVGTTIASAVPAFDGAWHHIRLDAVQNGSAIDVFLTVDGATAATGSVSSSTLGALGRAALFTSEDNADGTLPAVGHLAAWAPYAPNLLDPPDTADAAVGWAGETAAARIERLCTEEGIPIAVDPAERTSAAVGPQGIDTILKLLHAAADADRGALTEMRGDLGLRYRPLASLYNQAATELDYDAGHIAPPLTPTDDDQHAHNDVTTQRPGGSSARHVVDEGPLSTQAPPDGIGTYDRGAVEVNVAADDQLLNVAGWLAHLGTWDEARYPSVTVDLSAPALVADPGLSLALLALDTGDVLALTGLPAWLPPDDVSAMVQGVRLDLHQHAPQVAWNATPAGPYTVFVLDSSRLDTAGSTLTEDLTTTETIQDSTSPGAPWSTVDEPYDVVVGGERMTVTEVTGAGPAQTITCDRSVNGVVKTHSSGDARKLFQPGILAL